MEFDVSHQHSCLASLVPELATWLAWWIREATKLFAARAGILCRQVGHDVTLGLQLWQMMCPEEQLEMGRLRGME